MDGAGPGSGHAHAHFAGELRMCAGHERAHFLVARAHQFDLAARAVHRTHQTVDAVARITINTVYAPLPEALDDEITDQRRHCRIPSLRPTAIMRGRQ